jgi:hypothetical protein
MKRAKRQSCKRRNPVAVSPLLRKGGAHQRRDKKAIRARLKADARREIDAQGLK